MFEVLIIFAISASLATYIAGIPIYAMEHEDDYNGNLVLLAFHSVIWPLHLAQRVIRDAKKLLPKPKPAPQLSQRVTMETLMADTKASYEAGSWKQP